MLFYNDREILFGKFPNGESNLRLDFLPESLRLQVERYTEVTLKYEDDSDLFHLLLVRQQIRRPARLIITYVPYSRMDRASDTYAFSLKTFCEFINSMKWDSVTIYEPHSDVTPALLDRVKVVDVTTSPQMLSKVNIALGTDDYQAFYPDAGAQKRYSITKPQNELDKWRSAHELIGFKKRDFDTGKIIESSVIGEKASDNVVIFDDLCSKGGTFVLAAEKLKAMGYKKIILVVAHCENTIFLGEVFTSRLIDKVITTDSILSHPGDEGKLWVVPLAGFGG